MLRAADPAAYINFRKVISMGKAIDILLYVALSEEFDVVIDMLGSDFKSQEQVGVALTGFFGNIDSPVLNRSFEVAVFPAGKMGNTRSASLTSALIEKLNPANIVVLGIAGLILPSNSGHAAK